MSSRGSDLGVRTRKVEPSETKPQQSTNAAEARLSERRTPPLKRTPYNIIPNSKLPPPPALAYQRAWRALQPSASLCPVKLQPAGLAGLWQACWEQDTMVNCPHVGVSQNRGP